MKAWLEKQPDSIAYYISFTENASTSEAIWQIGKALGYENITTFEELRPLLQNGLYYLDNLESLAESSEGIAFLRELKNCPEIRILASSRVAIPLLMRNIKVEQLPIEFAIQLFCNTWTGQEKLLNISELQEFLIEKLRCHPLSIILIATLGESYTLEKLTSLWNEKGIALAKVEYDSNRLGNLSISLHITSDMLAEKYPSALILWGLASLFPQGISSTEIELLNEEDSLYSDEDLKHLTRHHILTRTGEHYKVLPPVARFALDNATIEANGFSWKIIKKIFINLTFPIIATADQIISTQESLDARRVLIYLFPAIHQFVLTEIRQPDPNLSMLVDLNTALRNLYMYNVLLSREILRELYPCLKSKNWSNSIDIANTLSAWGNLESRLDNVDRAQNLYEQATKLYREKEDELGLANTLSALGTLRGQLTKRKKSYVKDGMRIGGRSDFLIGLGD